MLIPLLTLILAGYF